MSSNGDAPVRYVITQDERRWVAKLSGPDEDGVKLAAFVKRNQIEGEILVTIEVRIPGEETMTKIGPMTIQTGELQ